MLFEKYVKVSFAILCTGRAGRVGPGRAGRAGRVAGVRRVTGRGPGQAGRGSGAWSGGSRVARPAAPSPLSL